MPKETTQAGKLGGLQQFYGTLQANSADLSHLEGSVKIFGTLLDRAEKVVKQQAALTAGKQESTQELRALLAEGERLATVLRSALKHHYGIRAEKLAEYGMQPFRGLKRKSKPSPEEPSEPTEPNPEKPVQAASSDPAQ